MKTERGIDNFRLVAAALVVAIHTGPLLSYSPTADFILTGVLARVAVPFFFMVNGYYLFAEKDSLFKNLKKLLKTNAILYLLSTLAYIPILLYAGAFEGPWSIMRILRVVVADGTMYHLWYFPAVIAGGLLVYAGVHFWGCTRTMAACTVLYVLGLLGDSYYGVAEQVPALHGFYQELFHYMNYTRNGLFFAPFFIMLGVMISRRPVSLGKNLHLILTLFWSLVLVAEGILLHRYGISRHNSMYLALPPLMYHVFSLLLMYNTRRNRVAKDLALWVYIAHPAVLVALRLLAKICHLPQIIQQSLLLYGLVLAGSILTGMGMHKIRKRLNGICPSREKGSRGILEVNLGALGQNVHTFMKNNPDCRFMAVVKADAYGHSQGVTCRYLNRLGVSDFAVATVDEAVRLRKEGVRGQILVLGYFFPDRIREMRRHDITGTIVDPAHGQLAVAEKKRVKVHLKVDTGMHRLGIPVDETEEILKLLQMKHLKVQGIFTHFAASDAGTEQAVSYTDAQMEAFLRLQMTLKSRGYHTLKFHAQCSSGAMNYTGLSLDYMRVGIGMYGTMSSGDDWNRNGMGLCPVMSIRTTIVHITSLKIGESAGYGMAFTAKRPSRIAVVPIGYGDGIPRALSGGRGYVLVHGKKIPIAGRICMDQMLIDITDLPEARLYDRVTILGRDGDNVIGITDMANEAGTIANEIFTGLSDRYTIKYI